MLWDGKKMIKDKWIRHGLHDMMGKSRKMRDGKPNEDKQAGDKIFAQVSEMNKNGIKF